MVGSVGENIELAITENATLEIGQTLIEKIGKIRQSLAGQKQEIIAPVVWIGSQQINVAQLMLDTLDVVKELAELTAAHTHANTGTPNNSGDIKRTATKSDGLKQKYSPVIG
nr:hypothetical protein [Morganella morganii]